MNSDHFQTARRDLRPPLARTPDIVSTTIEGADGWSETGELAFD